MSECFVSSADQAVITIVPIVANQYDEWLDNQDNKIKNWLNVNNFTAKNNNYCLLPNENGHLKTVFVKISNNDFWVLGELAAKLPNGYYQISYDWSTEQMERAAIAWGLGRYKFSEYKNISATKPKLVLPQCDIKNIDYIVNAIYLIRDLINYPAEDMNPGALAKIVTKIALEFDASVQQIIGEDLIKNNCHAIHAVGRASNFAPRLIELKWGVASNPKVVLVGKGVCFDSGGLNIKSPDNMALMKKDMAGAAHVLGLAKLIMQAKLPINLRVLIPTVENMIAGNSYKPGDVIKTYSGKTIEITNTDAEGRLILADSLAMASEGNPDLIIDFASLTGAARVALGPNIVAMFTENEAIAKKLLALAEQEVDPMWRLPLYEPYLEFLASDIADIKNSAEIKLGGAIVAALFLKQFIAPEIPWIHFDIMGYNLAANSGKPKGGEAMGLRVMFKYLQTSYCHSREGENLRDK